MTEMTTRRSGGYVDRPASSSLVDVLNVILDKGLVIDAFVRVSVVGIELITIDARIVIASVDTYLRFAEATNRLDLMETGGRDLPELTRDMSTSGAEGKSKGLLQGAKEAIFGEDDKGRTSEDDKNRRSKADEEADEADEPEERERERVPRQKKSPTRSPQRRPARREQS